MYVVKALRGPGNSDSQGYGINASGSVAGIAFPYDENQILNIVGARWKQGALDLSLPLQSHSVLYDLNANGTAAGVRAIMNTPTQIAIALQGTTVKDLSPAVDVGSLASGINDAGRICGWTWNTPKAWIFDLATDGVLAWIEPLPGAASCGANAINQAGEVAGKTNTNRGFFYAGGNPVDLGAAAFVSDVNDAGVVCGSIGKPFPQNFAPATCDAKKPNPVFAEIPIPAGFIGAHANGVNNNGEVVGTCWTAQSYNGKQSAYIYTGGTSTDLNTLISDPNWHLEFAERINDAGQISGIGEYLGETTAFLLSPPGVDAIVSVPDLVGWLLGGPDVDAGGWNVLPGGRRPIGPWGPFLRMSEPKRDALIALALDEVAMYVMDNQTRLRVRTALIEAARNRLGAHLELASEGRSAPTVRRAGAGTSRVPTRDGKPTNVLARFRH